MHKKLGDMTPAERDAAIKRATKAFQAELDANADQISAILDAPGVSTSPHPPERPDRYADERREHERAHSYAVPGCQFCAEGN